LEEYYIHIYIKTSIKRNILTVKQNTSGSRSGSGLISTPVFNCLNFIFIAIIGLAPVIDRETCLTRSIRHDAGGALGRRLLVKQEKKKPYTL
jgi:hypothetical protein